MMLFLAQAIIFYLPGAAANVSAVLNGKFAVFRSITVPADFGLTLRGIRLVGPHKTWGGVLAGVAGGTLTGLAIHSLLYPLFPELRVFPLTTTQAGFLYLLMSSGAIFGDLFESFAKRQLRIDPHKPFIPFDEIDHSVFGMLIVSLFFPVSTMLFITVVTIYFLVHIIANVVGFLVGIKKVPY